VISFGNVIDLYRVSIVPASVDCGLIQLTKEGRVVASKLRPATRGPGAPPKRTVLPRQSTRIARTARTLRFRSGEKYLSSGRFMRVNVINRMCTVHLH